MHTKKTELPFRETFIDTNEFFARFKISKPTQCKHRKDGNSPPFVLCGNKILYPESLATAWFQDRLLENSAQISPNLRGKRYQHLSQARELAAKARTKKTRKI